MHTISEYVATREQKLREQGVGYHDHGQNGSTVLLRYGQGVKADFQWIFGWSRILTTVADSLTVPMGVIATPLGSAL